MLGCGTTNHLQSIQVTAALINGVVPTGQTGFLNLKGIGATIQFKATGKYSDTKTRDLSNVVTWNVIVDPNNGFDVGGNALFPPCKAPCSDPSEGTVQYNTTGLITS